MSNFIVPLTGLPSITSIQSQTAAKTGAVPGGVPFAGVLEEAVQNLAGAGESSRSSMYNLAVGASDDLHTGAIDMVKHGAAVSYTSGMVSGVIRAYNELMRMTV